LEREKVNIHEVNKQEKVANSIGYGLYKIKDTNKAPFGQTISENIEMLRDHEYLTGADKAFLFDIEPLIEMHSNILVNKSTGEFMTVSDIARCLDKSVPHTSKIVNRLINKGVLFEMTNVQEIKQFGRSITKRPIFMNPEIMFKGNRNEINASLARLTMNLDPFEKQKIHLPWKVWMPLHAQSGKLYRRKTYVKYKKEN